MTGCRENGLVIKFSLGKIFTSQWNGLKAMLVLKASKN